MTTPTPGEREARRQHEHWAAAHARLMGSPDKPKMHRVRPRSAAALAHIDDAAAAMDFGAGYIGPFPHLSATVSAGYPPSSVVVIPEHYYPPALKWKSIMNEVARKHRVSFVDLLSPRRDRKTVHARHEIFWRLREETTMSLPQIGRRFGGRDHTTVLHGIRAHERRLAEAEAT